MTYTSDLIPTAATVVFGWAVGGAILSTPYPSLVGAAIGGLVGGSMLLKTMLTENEVLGDE